LRLSLVTCPVALYPATCATQSTCAVKIYEMRRKAAVTGREFADKAKAKPTRRKAS
jgi:non-homologous end joining protein Ku